MFNPNQEDVRRFFCEAFRKHRAGEPLQALELLSAQWMDAHPEYHATFADLEAALRKMGQPATAEEENPFLHISMHLAISEQCSIDQPRGVRQAVELLAQRLGSLHDAHHLAMEALGRMIWESQRSGRPPDGQAYVEALQRLATRG